MRAARDWGVPTVRALVEATYFAGLRKAGMPEECPRLPVRSDPGLLTRDRISLHFAYIHVSADLRAAIVEDGFDIKAATRPIVDIYQDRTRRRQDIGAQKIDIPELGADRRDINLYDGHPRVVGKLNPSIQRGCRGSGGGL